MDIREMIRSLAGAQRCFETDQVRDYESLERLIRQIEVGARETFQELVREQAEALARKLEDGAPLTIDEKQTLELLIVGDARYYLKYENDFENWKVELKRLLSEIDRIQPVGAKAIDELLRLQALCRDARTVLPGINYYLQEKERLQRFQTSTQSGVNPEVARILAEILREMISSTRM